MPVRKGLPAATALVGASATGIALLAGSAQTPKPPPVRAATGTVPGPMVAAWDRRPQSYRELVALAPAAVVATVAEVRQGPLATGGSPDDALPTQRISLSVVERWFGAVPDTFELAKTGSADQWLEGDPPYRVGERYALRPRPPRARRHLPARGPRRADPARGRGAHAADRGAGGRAAPRQDQGPGQAGGRGPKGGLRWALTGLGEAAWGLPPLGLAGDGDRLPGPSLGRGPPPVGQRLAQARSWRLGPPPHSPLLPAKRRRPGLDLAGGHPARPARLARPDGA